MTFKSHLINTYGEVTEKKTIEIQKMKRQAMSEKCRWIFMSRCIKHNVLPRSFQTRPVRRTKKGYQLTKEYNTEMLCATQDQTQQQYHDYLKRIKDINEQLDDSKSTDNYIKVTQITETTRENQFKVESKRLKEKFV